MLPTAPDWPQVSRNIASHLRYAVDIMAQVPSQLVLRNHLPWSHPRLHHIYQSGSGATMPRSMQDAFSSCALYLAKNTTNAQVIVQCINARLDDLVQAWPLVVATALVTALVAYTQALLLYNIIAIFDADMDARRVIEKTRGLLCTSAQQLAPSAFALGTTGPGSTALSDNSSAWDDWVLAETARRTALMAHYFIHMNELLMAGDTHAVAAEVASDDFSRILLSSMMGRDV